MRIVLSLLLAFAAAPQFQSLIQEGLAALQEKDFAKAQTSLEEATVLEPESAPTWFLLAQTYSENDNLTAALDAAGKAAQFAGSDATILFNVALFYINANKADESIATANRALALENSSDVRMLLGQAHAAKQEWPEAVIHYREAQRLSPYSDQVLFELAQTYMFMQDFPNAIAVLEEGRKTFVGVAQLELALGVAYYGQRRFSDAVDSFLNVMRMAPEVAQPYYFLGKILQHASDHLPEITERAIQFEKIAPQSPLGYVLQARTIMQQLPPSQYPPEAGQAHDLLQKALAIKEDQPDAHYLMGTLLARKKEYEAAARHLERSIELDETALEPHFRLAVVYNRLGRKEDAARERAIHEKLSAEEGTVGSVLLPASQ